MLTCLMSLANMMCVPCEVGAPVATSEEIKKYMSDLTLWKLTEDSKKIKRDYEFSGFSDAVSFINKVAAVAESQGHHPDLCLHDFKYVEVELWTHKIGGLHRNDFVMAAKLDQLV